MYQSRFDRFIAMLERSAHALRMGLLLAGVVMGSAALYIMFGGPDPERAEAFLERLQTEDMVPVTAIAEDGWTHICLGEERQDVRTLIGLVTAEAAPNCSGFNRSFFFYDGYAALGIITPLACDILPVPTEKLDLTGGKGARCIERNGLMMFRLKGGTKAPVLILERI